MKYMVCQAGPERARHQTMLMVAEEVMQTPLSSPFTHRDADISFPER